MKPAAEIMKEKINNTKFNNPYLKLLIMLLQSRKESQILKNY